MFLSWYLRIVILKKRWSTIACVQLQKSWHVHWSIIIRVGQIAINARFYSCYKKLSSEIRELVGRYNRLGQMFLINILLFMVLSCLGRVQIIPYICYLLLSIFDSCHIKSFKLAFHLKKWQDKWYNICFCSLLSSVIPNSIRNWMLLNWSWLLIVSAVKDSSYC